MTRVTMWMLLAVVAAAAAVLSFSALRDLAVMCGFSTSLGWLLPLVVDAGAAAGCLVWLGGGKTPQQPMESCHRFARSLTFVLLASSVAGNALVHYLSAYSLRPAWWVVVMVSAVAPSVLGAVVHLAVLVGRTRAQCVGDYSEGSEYLRTPEGDADSARTCAHFDDQPDFWRDAPYADTERGRAAELIDSGAGRRRLATELNVSEYRARQILAERNGVAS